MEAQYGINYYSLTRVRKNLNNQLVSKFKHLFENAGKSLSMRAFLANTELLNEAQDELKLCREKERPNA